MTDETNTPPTGQGPGLPDFDSPEWNAERDRLEKAFMAAGQALAKHAGARGACVPLVDEGEPMVVAFGRPLTVLNMVTQVCESFAERHAETHNPLAVIAALLGRKPEGMVMVAVGGADADDDDENCDCEHCQNQQKHPN